MVLTRQTPHMLTRCKALAKERMRSNKSCWHIETKHLDLKNQPLRFSSWKFSQFLVSVQEKCPALSKWSS